MAGRPDPRTGCQLEGRGGMASFHLDGDHEALAAAALQLCRLAPLAALGTIMHAANDEIGARNEKLPDGRFAPDVPTDQLLDLFAAETKGTDVWYQLNRERNVRMATGQLQKAPV